MEILVPLPAATPMQPLSSRLTRTWTKAQMEQWTTWMGSWRTYLCLQWQTRESQSDWWANSKHCQPTTPPLLQLTKNLVGDNKLPRKEIKALKKNIAEKAVDTRDGWSKLPAHGTGTFPWWLHKGWYCWYHIYGVSKGNNKECNHEKTGNIASYTRFKPQGGCQDNIICGKWWVGITTTDIKIVIIWLNPMNWFHPPLLDLAPPV